MIDLMKSITKMLSGGFGTGLIVWTILVMDGMIPPVLISTYTAVSILADIAIKHIIYGLHSVLWKYAKE
jgi:hypothetical protein